MGGTVAGLEGNSNPDSSQALSPRHYYCVGGEGRLGLYLMCGEGWNLTGRKEGGGEKEPCVLLFSYYLDLNSDYRPGCIPAASPRPRHCVCGSPVADSVFTFPVETLGSEAPVVVSS